jgi:DNA replicative helicase MCM subunit Mcm2 (Cdc46/Mcm family)
MKEVLEKLWTTFYPLEIYDPKDSRNELIQILIDFFQSDENGKRFLLGRNLGVTGTIHFNVQEMNKFFPFPDVEAVVIQKNIEFSGTIGLALSCIANTLFPYLEIPIIKYPAFYNLSKSLFFSDVKSTTVGKLISLKGHVVKVSPCRPLVIEGEFRCSKCLQNTRMKFLDGIFNPPVQCKTVKCYSKSLEFNKKTIRTVDFQRIKLSELDRMSSGNEDQCDDENNDNNLARIPKTLEIEIRSSLVNTCIVGDVINVVGIVKAMQVRSVIVILILFAIP